MAAAQEGDARLVRVLVNELHCKPNTCNKVSYLVYDKQIQQPVGRTAMQKGSNSW